MDVFERDFYEERRRSWRRSAFWKGFFIAAVIAGIIAALGLASSLETRGEHVARYSVTGVITDDPKRDRLIADLEENEAVKAVILRINSPGGTTAGSEALYETIRGVAGRKPVVAVMSEVAASGGYVAAIAADHIVARGNTLTGSIGVIMEYPDLTALIDRLGIGVETVRSSELKAEPSPYRPVNPEARARDEAMIADGFLWFRGLVGERRDLSGSDLDAVANGGVFSGRQALDGGLIDEIGGEPEALAWLESRETGLGDLPVREWEVERDKGILAGLLGRVASSGGILTEISGRTGAKLYSIMR
jgi:protease-4